MKNINWRQLKWGVETTHKSKPQKLVAKVGPTKNKRKVGPISFESSNKKQKKIFSQPQAAMAEYQFPPLFPFNDIFPPLFFSSLFVIHFPLQFSRSLGFFFLLSFHGRLYLNPQYSSASPPPPPYPPRPEQPPPFSLPKFPHSDREMELLGIANPSGEQRESRGK